VTHIDLFSGIGGFALAAKWAGFQTVAFVEIEPYAQELIKQNFGAVPFTDAKRCNGRENDQGKTETGRTRLTPCLFGDISTFDGTRYRGATLLTGGFPCQPFSQAGKRRGAADDRALWPEMFRVIQQARPAWVLGENVAGIIDMELDRVLSDLESEGYAVQALVIPACAVDAKHRRDRVWIVAYAEGRSVGTGLCENESTGERGRRSGYCRWPDEGEWFAESGMGRVAHGIPNRVDRLKGLGNAIVPQVAYEIVKGIAEIERAK
jgi:DNA (cytosine-5)-methyltransferase 1